MDTAGGRFVKLSRVGAGAEFILELEEDCVLVGCAAAVAAVGGGGILLLGDASLLVVSCCMLNVVVPAD
jgi:hypothetical protein